MLTIPDAVRLILKRDPIISDILARGLLNYSEYARYIQPKIEEMLFKEVRFGTIVTALGRIEKEVKILSSVEFFAKDITIKSPISEISFQRSSYLESCLRSLYIELHSLENNFLSVISGNTEVTIFLNTAYEQQVLDLIRQKPTLNQSGLAVISLKFDPKYYNEPGVNYRVLQVINWHKISLAEVVSTYTEISLVAYQKNIQKCYEILSEAFVLS